MESQTLPEDLLRHLAGRGDVRRFGRGEILVHEGARGGGIHVMLAGRANVFTAGADGRELIYNTVHAGEILGEMLLDGGVRSASVRAVTDVECLHVGEHELADFMVANPEFAGFLVVTLIQRLRHATTLIRQLGLNDVSERVIDVLRSEATRVDGRLLVPKALTQQEISQRVGATREMVNHVVRRLTKAGYLRRLGPRDVEVVRELPDSIRTLPPA